MNGRLIVFYLRDCFNELERIPNEAKFQSNTNAKFVITEILFPIIPSPLQNKRFEHGREDSDRSLNQ